MPDQRRAGVTDDAPSLAHRDPLRVWRLGTGAAGVLTLRCTMSRPSSVRMVRFPFPAPGRNDPPALRPGRQRAPADTGLYLKLPERTTFFARISGQHQRGAPAAVSR